jgi:FkbM family methyltransferase
MNPKLRKLIRTVQSELYFLKGAKDKYYYYSRRALGKPHEIEWYGLKFIPDSLPGCYVDIGANHGQSIESIKLVKPNARVYSFEPNPLLAEKLKQHYHGRQDITIFPYGLAEKPSRSPLYVPIYKKFVYDGEASFDKEDAAALFSHERLYFFDPRKLELRRTTCELRLLDEQQLDPIFIKIDVQGYEYQVMTGGKHTINRCDPVLMLEGIHGNADLTRLIDELGYEEYVFDDTGFYSGTAPGAVNALLMTRSRFATVQRSSRHPH